MIRKPRFRRHLRVEHFADDGATRLRGDGVAGEPGWPDEPGHREEASVLVVTDGDYRVLRGHVARIAPFVTGEFTTDEIVEALAGTVPSEIVRGTIVQLEQRGYLSEAGDPVGAGDSRTVLDPAEGAFWDALGADPAQAAERLRHASVCVTSVGAGPGAEVELADSLAAHHVRRAEKAAGADLQVVVTTDYLDDELEPLNAAAIASGTPFLLVRPVGVVSWIGPLVVPRKTACWACLADRLRFNSPARTWILRNGIGGPDAARGLPVASTVSSRKAVLSLAAIETAKWIVGRTGSLAGTLVTIDLRTLTTERHVVTRRPQCPVCGARAAVGRRGASPSTRPEHPPIALGPAPKAFTDEGGHRTVPPRVTFERYAHHVSPVTGVIREITSIAADAGDLIHSYTTGQYSASQFEGPGLIRKNLRNISGGKGRTDAGARASALCEGLERYSAIYQGDEPAVRGTLSGLGDDAIHPNDVACFSEQQLADRERLNAAATIPSQWIPPRFDRRSSVDWTPVWSLTHEKTRYLPTSLCYYGYPGAGAALPRADSNGCAAGNSLEEAILQGLMELVERDAVAIWWYNRIRVRGVDLDGFDDPYFSQLRDYYAANGRELWVLDATSDLGIPAFVAVSRRVDRAREDIIFGFGAHFDARLGVLRALTEMNQILPTILGIREDERGRPIHPDRLAMQWWEEATLDGQPYLVPDTSVSPGSDYPDRSRDDLSEDIRECQTILEDHGLEVCVLDQTRPDVGLPVAKLIVPGLRHYWPRFGAGRLYEVPVATGRLDVPLAEASLNPYPLFF